MSVLQKVAKRNLPVDPLEHLNLESQIIQLSDDIDMSLQTTEGDIQEIKKQSDDIDKGYAAANGLEGIVNYTAKTYKEGGMDEASTQLYRTSVESVLRVAGIDLPVDVVVPSFESAEDYSAEAEEKGNNLIQRIFKWIGEAFEKFVEIVRNFFSKLFTNVPTLKKLSAKIRKKVEDVSGTPKSDKNLSFGGASKYICDSNGSIIPPRTLMEGLVHNYQAFCVDWNRIWDAAIAVGAPNSIFDDASIQKWIRDVYKFGDELNRVKGGVEKIQFSPNWRVELTGGADKQHPVIGCKVRIVAIGEKAAGGAKILTKSDMESGIDRIDEALKQMDKIKNIVDTVVSKAEKGSKYAKVTHAVSYVQSKMGSKPTEDGPSPRQIEDLKIAMRMMTSACSAMSVGWTQSMSIYLQTVRGALKYVSVSANQYGSSKGDEGAEVKKGSKVERDTEGRKADDIEG